MLSSERTAPAVTRGLAGAGSVRVTLAGLAHGRTSSVVISRAAVAGSGLFTVLLTSRLLSPDARGVFAALQASVTIMGVCGCASLWLGISVLLARRPAARWAAVKLAVIWPVCLSALLAVVLLVVGPPPGIGTGVAAAFIAVSLPAMVYSNLQGVPIGLNRMTSYARAEVLRATVALVLVGCGMALAGWRSPAVLVLLWGCGSWTLASVYVLAACRPYRRERVAGFVRAVVSRSVRVHPNSVVWLAVQRLDIVVLAALSSHAQVAYYSLGVAIAEGVWLVPGAIAITGLADYSRLEPAEASAVVRRNVRRTLTWSTGTAVVLLVLGSGLILLVLSPAYHAAIAPLAVTVAGTTIVSAGQAISPWVAATLNRPGLSSLIASATLALDMGVLVAAAGLGALGAAIASSVAYLAATLCYFAVYLRFRHPEPDAPAHRLASPPLA
jgi:O-antigen/teichoic acid export membrane protein